jgi:hypothetical protein
MQLLCVHDLGGGAEGRGEVTWERNGDSFWHRLHGPL